MLVLAGGSNVVVSDTGFPGTVVLIRSRGVRVSAEDSGGPTLTVAAGEPWDEVVAQAVAAGWSGVECLSGVPGSAGATPIQNVGAYGHEVAEAICSVRAYDRFTGQVVTLGAGECGFGYRSSVFKQPWRDGGDVGGRWVVLSVDLRLARSPQSVPVTYAELARALDIPLGGTAPLAEVRAAVLTLRAGKGMVLDPDDPDTYSAGSFFTNPVLDPAAYEALCARAAASGDVSARATSAGAARRAAPPAWPGPGGVVKVSAAWLIEHAGFHKGHAGRGVSISSKHTLALTNRGSGSTAALLDLAREIRDGVHARFGVTLHPEPVLVGCSL